MSCPRTKHEDPGLSQDRRRISRPKAQPQPQRTNVNQAAKITKKMLFLVIEDINTCMSVFYFYKETLQCTIQLCRFSIELPLKWNFLDDNES